MWSWGKLLGMTLMLLVLVSCQSTPPNLQPDPEQEAYRDPPPGDRRYAQPVQYPREFMNRDPYAKKKALANKQQSQFGRGPSNFGGPR